LNCHSDHPLCPKVSSAEWVPSRLLKIEFNDQQNACLVEPLPHPTTRWAALSYVWGGDQIIKTTVSSLSKMNESFAIRTLPQTLQDAFTVCRKIGLQYLWIDCLCIVQDDEDDLARELATMPQIYQRAWVTISASTANHVDTGFLHDRGHRTRTRNNMYSPSFKLAAPISLPYVCEDSISTGAIVLQSGQHVYEAPLHVYHDHLDSNQYDLRQESLPINLRAWYVFVTYRPWFCIY
jgi:hypothetical protein